MPDPLLAELAEATWIGGCPRESRGWLPVEDPATAEVLAEVALVDAALVLEAVEAAVAAAPAWAATAPQRRADLLARAEGMLRSRVEEGASLITAEAGKPVAEARAEIEYAADYLRWYAADAVRLAGSVTPSPSGEADLLVERRPVGPCYLVTPWNLPLAMAARKVAPALAAGCTTIVKPSELTPLTMLWFARILAEAGAPEGVVSVLVSDEPAMVTAHVLGDPRVRKVSFTGSTRVGRALLQSASAHVVRASMELGGNAPFLVLPGADTELAVAAALTAKGRNAGQTCVAPNRFLVHESLHDEVVDGLVERYGSLVQGPGRESTTQVGPLITAAAASRVDGLVEDAVVRGATRATAARPPRSGHFVAPTVLVNVPSDAPVWEEEVFGPVISVQAYRDVADAVAEANRTDAGLAAYVIGPDRGCATDVARCLEVGMVAVNDGRISEVAAPFGGVRSSGLGREGGLHGIDEYLEERYVRIPRGGPLLTSLASGAGGLG